MNVVTVYGRTSCHLCTDVVALLNSMKDELNFEIKEVLIDNDERLISLYSEQVPLIHIDGVHHDFGRVDPKRFKSSLEKHRQHQ